MPPTGKPPSRLWAIAFSVLALSSSDQTNRQRNHHKRRLSPWPGGLSASGPDSKSGRAPDDYAASAPIESRQAEHRSDQLTELLGAITTTLHRIALPKVKGPHHRLRRSSTRVKRIQAVKIVEKDKVEDLNEELKGRGRLRGTASTFPFGKKTSTSRAGQRIFDER